MHDTAGERPAEEDAQIAEATAEVELRRLAAENSRLTAEAAAFAQRATDAESRLREMTAKAAHAEGELAARWADLARTIAARDDLMLQLAASKRQAEALAANAGNPAAVLLGGGRKAARRLLGRVLGPWRRLQE